jgi:3-oxoacyl-[acyl-carrier protein] reductase
LREGVLMISFEQKTILVTGATSGIGYETATLLHKLGAKLILIGRNENRVEKLKSELPEQIVISYDLNQVDKTFDLLKGIAKEHGSISGLVHAAGIHEVTPLRTLSVEQTKRLFKVNVETTLQLLKACSNKRIMCDGGSVVLLSSASGLVGEPGVIAYSASKGAIVSITKSAAMELAGRDIRVNCLAPGIVETPMSENIRDKIGNEQWDVIKQSHPLGLGQPIDVANPIAFLLSEGAKWMTGTVIPVDGGYTVH